jgi:serine protease Do/serine protease DegQ
VNDFATKGTVSRPFLGVRYTFITPDMGMMYNLPQGAYIQEVVPDSSADKVGIQAGEVITKIDRQAVNNESKISQTIAGKKAGDSLNLTVWSDGQEKQVNVTLQESQNQ